MPAAARVFYLAVFSLLAQSHAGSHVVPSKSKVSPTNVCHLEPGAIVSDACASYNTLEQLNEAIHPYLDTITKKTDFFSHYRLSLFSKKCPFWDDANGMCGNVACSVNTLENERDIPLVWRAKELGKLEGPTAHHPGKKEQKLQRKRPLQGGLGKHVDESCVVEYDDECDERDYCIPDDESATAKGDYVSLVDNQERFTGYAGVGAQQVWEAIYRENCFSKPPRLAASKEQQSFSGASPFSRFGNQEQMLAANQFRSVMKEQLVQQKVQSAIAHGVSVERLDPVEFDDTCLEKRVFHRVISGMHASISTHLCYDYLNQKTGEWGPNLTCYEQRLHNYPDRISNIYFNYALVMRAVGKIKQHIQDYSFCSEDPLQDSRTKNSVLRLASALPAGPEIFDETVMFKDADSIALKEDFRNRFRNVSRIMDCVGCDKCRLWGKLQTNGYGTALKVLFEFDDKDSSKDPPLRRTELVALINTFDRLSHSLSSIKKFRSMMEDGEAAASGKPVVQSIADTEKPVMGVRLALQNYDEQEPTPQETHVSTKEEDDGFPSVERDWNPDKLSAWEDFMKELELVMRTFVWVLRAWSELPRRLGKIFVLELARLYNWWLGFMPGPRNWEIRYPTRDDL